MPDGCKSRLLVSKPSVAVFGVFYVTILWFQCSVFRFQERKAQDLTPETRHLKPQQGPETFFTNGFDLHPCLTDCIHHFMEQNRHLLLLIPTSGALSEVYRIAVGIQTSPFHRAVDDRIERLLGSDAGVYR